MTDLWFGRDRRKLKADLDKLDNILEDRIAGIEPEAEGEQWKDIGMPKAERQKIAGLRAESARFTPRRGRRKGRRKHSDTVILPPTLDVFVADLGRRHHAGAFTQTKEDKAVSGFGFLVGRCAMRPPTTKRTSEGNNNQQIKLDVRTLSEAETFDDLELQFT